MTDHIRKPQQQQQQQHRHNPSSTQSRESGFQSSASLTSLEKRCQQLLSSGKDSTVDGQGVSPASTLTDSLGEEDDDSNNNNSGRRNEEKLTRNGRISADSMTSIISGLSDSASNTDASRRHSLTTIKQSVVAANMGRMPNANVSQHAARRSTRVSRNQQFRLQIQDDCSLISAGFASGKGKII